MFCQKVIIGLLGKSLKHSFSKKYFDDFFVNNNFVNFEYKNFEIPSIDFLPLLINQNENIIGLNVTIPFKQEVLRYVNKKSEEVEKVGAANTLLIERFFNDTFISAFNTDVYGFEVSLKNFLDKKIAQAIVIGNGGASKSVCYVLDKLGVDFHVVARKRKSEDELLFEDLEKEIVQSADLIVNTTPVGQFPNISEKLDFPFEYISNKHYCYDLVYNPFKTIFLKKSEDKGAKVFNGIEMLYLQAEKSWELFYQASKKF